MLIWAFHPSKSSSFVQWFELLENLIMKKKMFLEVIFVLFGISDSRWNMNIDVIRT